MSRVVSGLERWIRQDATPLAAGARVALVVHAASVDSRARHALELIRESAHLCVERVFAPEHGLFGHEQDMERVGSSTDPLTGLPVISLYGDNADSLRPRREDLAGLDAIVFDLQDVGSRYYTFVYTLSFVMEAARECASPVVVLTLM